MPTTNENLKTAFGGESQAYQKYKAFADAARKEGFENVAKLFETTAEAEKLHAVGHLKALDAIKSTAENLKEAIGGETYEFDDMYPPMYEQAKAEDHKAKRMFGYALEAEKVHAALYEEALKAVNEGRDLEDVTIYLCPICGHIELKEPTSACPICGVKAEKYVQV